MNRFSNEITWRTRIYHPGVFRERISFLSSLGYKRQKLGRALADVMSIHHKSWSLFKDKVLKYSLIKDEIVAKKRATRQAKKEALLQAKKAEEERKKLNALMEEVKRPLLHFERELRECKLQISEVEGRFVPNPERRYKKKAPALIPSQEDYFLFDTLCAKRVTLKRAIDAYKKNKRLPKSWESFLKQVENLRRSVEGKPPVVKLVVRDDSSDGGRDSPPPKVVKVTRLTEKRYSQYLTDFEESVQWVCSRFERGKPADITFKCGKSSRDLTRYSMPSGLTQKDVRYSRKSKREFAEELEYFYSYIL